jgi:Ca2+-binding RTX toxin-like protein
VWWGPHGANLSSWEQKLMPTVTVPGANNSTVKLVFDNDANAVLAQYVAGVIQAGITAGTILPADNKNGPPPPLPAGKTGELVVSKAGTQFVPGGYDYIVASAKSANVFGNSDANQQVLVGEGNMSFFAAGGSGSVVGGGGNDLIAIAPTDAGAWMIALGDGNDSVRAFGSGNDTISLGSGHSILQLGSGSTFVTTTGSDTVMAGSGSETIDASGGDHAKEVIYGNSSKLFFVAGGAASVFGGSGSDTMFGGTGRDLFEGGSGGNNFLQAGSGRATLFGGGDGDQLYAGGDKAQELHAASGNETLSGVFASGRDTFYGGSGSDQIFGGSGKNTFVAGTGTATVTASPGTMNLFDFMKTVGGGTELVTGLTAAAQVHIELLGYGPDEVKYALAHQTVADGSVTVTLSDNTSVTFQNVGALSSSNFLGGASSNGNSSGGGGSDDSKGNRGHSGHNS